MDIILYNRSISKIKKMIGEITGNAVEEVLTAYTDEMDQLYY